MNSALRNALTIGTERVAGWAELLDRINVFPVADGDTGRNLVITLSPLLKEHIDRDELTERILLSARGNSGNIAARFLSGMMQAPSAADLPVAISNGRELAWKAVPDPREGTMLSVFDTLAEALQQYPPGSRPDWDDAVVNRLQDAVLATTDQLPSLREAGVVDSGALGMLLFCDGFLRSLTDCRTAFINIPEVFKERIQLASTWNQELGEEGCCIDAVMDASEIGVELEEKLAALGESVVVMSHEGKVKVHLHADDVDSVRVQMADLGTIVSFASDDLQEQQKQFRETRPEPALHIMTDAAGSVTRDDASEFGMTLLDSYINVGRRSVPETYLESADLYAAMQAEIAVSTSQASDFERYQHYQRVMALFPRALYLCVGSAYTGNYRIVSDWKRDNDPEGKLEVMDTGAASGRLGLIALATARYSLQTSNPDSVVRFAQQAVLECKEYIFLEKLRYLAAGGRLSKSKAFFGDMLRKKPVITPLPGGAEKVAVLTTKDDQVAFALNRLETESSDQETLNIMLEYTDNESWVREVMLPKVTQLRPRARIFAQRISLTSGVHMGPGTWAIAYLNTAVSGER
jgi:uncharacterized protein